MPANPEPVVESDCLLLKFVEKSRPNDVEGGKQSLATETGAEKKKKIMDNLEAMYWLAIIQQAKEGDKEAQELLRQEDEFRTETGQPTVQEALRQKAEQAAHPYINPNPDERDLTKILMEDGKETAQEWLMTQPKTWREAMIEAIYECLKRGWTLHIGHIQMMARELDAKRNPKGW